MSGARVGPAGGLVGPSGGLVGGSDSGGPTTTQVTTAVITITGNGPGAWVNVTTAAVTITGQAPTLRFSAPTATITITGQAPIQSSTSQGALVGPAGGLVGPAGGLVGGAGIAGPGAPTYAQVTVAIITITGHRPGPDRADVTPAVITITGHNPISGPTIETAVVTITGQTPARRLPAASGVVTLTGQKPALRFPSPQASVTLTGQAPLSGVIVTPTQGNVVVTGQRPGPDVAQLSASTITVRPGPVLVERLWAGPPSRTPIGQPTNEIYEISLPNYVTGGTFTVTADSGLGTTGAIAWNATRSSVESIIHAAWGNDILVTGDDLPAGPIVLEFAGAYASQRILVTLDLSGLTYDHPGDVPTVVAQATAISATNTLAVGIPGSRVAGDQIFVSVSFDGLSNNSVTPAVVSSPALTWSLIKLSNIGTGDQYLVTWMATMTSDFATASTPTITVNASPDVSRDWSAVSWTVHNYLTNELVGEYQDYTNNISHVTGSIGTPSHANSLLIVAWSEPNYGSGADHRGWASLSASMTEVGSRWTNWSSVLVAKEAVATPVSLGTRTVSFNGAYGNTVTQDHWFVLRAQDVPPTSGEIITEIESGSNGGFGGGGTPGGGGPGVPGGGPSEGGADPAKPGNINILVGPPGAEVDIATRVLFEDAEFISTTNGLPGSCHFKVLVKPGDDPDIAGAIITGARVTLVFKQINQWTGYIMNVVRSYPFIYEDIVQTKEFFLEVEGADINILFRQRVVFKLADPSADGSEAMTFLIKDGPTKDTVAIAELVNNWLDLSGDDLDVSGLVKNVADINTDQDVTPWSWGWTWEQAMSSIAQLPAAIWCIDPDRRLVYADVDDRDAPFVLQDRLSSNPAAATYRELEIIHDGSDLVTDVMAWGLGTGDKKAVFKRIESDPEGHGLWQDGELRYDVYKQNTINKVATSIINGSPSSHRGHKYDKISVIATTFVAGFRAGQRVGFRSYAWDYVDTIPIRKIRITFPVPTAPMFELTMSHEIDAPWNFIDVFNFNLPEIQDYSFPITFTRGIGPCKIGYVSTTMLVDKFDRSYTSSDWGYSPCGPWFMYGSNHGIFVAAPPPHCYLTRGFSGLSIGDTGLSGVSAYGGSWNVNLYSESFQLKVSGASGPQVGEPMASGSGLVFPVYHSDGVTPVSQFDEVFVRAVKLHDALWFKAWPVDEEEPSEFHVISWQGATVYINGDPYTTEPIFPGGHSPGGCLQLNRPVPVVVTGGPGWGWVWYDHPIPSRPATNIFIPDAANSWKLRFFPAGDGGPTYPNPEPYIDALDAMCDNLSAPHFPRSASSSQQNTLAIGGSPGPYLLYAADWAWDTDFYGTPDNPVTQDMGQMIDYTWNVVSFKAPPGAWGAEVTFTVYINAPSTGLFGLGDQPDPSGEGVIGYEIWQLFYNSGDTIPPAHTVIASGFLDDYKKWSLPLVYSAEHTVSVGIPALNNLQLTAKITNSDYDLINTHGPTQSFASNSGGRRVLQVVIKDVKLRFYWDPVACGDSMDSGETIETLTGLHDTVVHIAPYFKGTTKIWENGHILTLGTDYEETTPLEGVITLSSMPAYSATYVVIYRKATRTGGAGLPTDIKLRPDPTG